MSFMRFSRVALAVSSALLILVSISSPKEGQIEPREALSLAVYTQTSTTLGTNIGTEIDTHADSSHASGTQGHSETGLVADDLTSLRDEEWAWVTRAESAGFDVAFTEMVKQYDSDPRNSPHCHQLVHELGRRAYKKYTDLGKALSFEVGWCGGGFTHGVFEAWGRTFDASKSSSDLAAKCASLSLRDQSCGHGIGHAIMQTTPELPDALATCGSLPDNLAWDCIDGVMMLYSQSYLAPALDDPRPDMGFSIKEFCDLIPSKYLQKCEWIAGATWLGVTRNPDRGRAMEQCLSLKDSKDSATRCAYGIGDTVPDVSGWDGDKAVEVCKTGPDNLESWCIESALRLLNNFMRDAGKPDLCPTVSQANRNLCQEAVLAPDRRRV